MATSLSDLQKVSQKPILKEKDGSVIKCYTLEELEGGQLSNWGGNVVFKPTFTFEPKTKEGVCNIVKWAKGNNARIRVGGYRHTWDPVYSDDGSWGKNTIFISLLSLQHIASDTSATVDPNGTGAGKEFRTIEYLPYDGEKDKILCKVGAAVTNDELREFCLETISDSQGSKWTIPYNVVLVENTISGMISSICHGSGSQHTTLSELVYELEFVNANGALQRISMNDKDEAELLKSAAGSFGILGVITSITLKLDRMSYAKTNPQKMKVLAAIPPVLGTKLESLPKKWRRGLDQKTLDEMIQNNTAQFIDHCEKDYYSEWFWFVLQDKCWVNCWKKDDPSNYKKNEKAWDEGGGKLYQAMKTKFQNVMASFAGLFDKEGGWMPKPPLQAEFVKAANGMLMVMLPTGEQILPLPEALHFQRGIRHVHARDIEVEIPIPKKANGKPDWDICRKAWWDAISIIYKKLDVTGTLPVNFTLEMRIMGGSNMTMAAQKGNQYTCSIEVLSTLLVPKEEWHEIAEEILAQWVSYKDDQGQPLAIRSHWAKEWDGLKFGSQNARSFVKNAYSKDIPVFKDHLSQVAQAGGYSIDDMRMFSNGLWDDIVFNQRPAPALLMSPSATALNNPVVVRVTSAANNNDGDDRFRKKQKT